MTNTECKYLIFTLQGRRFAFDLSQVAEVDEPPATWPIPGAPRGYSGAMNFHDTIVAVMDLADFLGLPSYYDLEKVIVLNPRIASLAFLVERVLRIAPADQVSHSGPLDEPSGSTLLLLPEGEVTLLDAALIAQRAADTINQ